MNQNGINFFNVGIVDEFGRPLNTSLLTSIAVYTAGTNTLATLYQDESRSIAQTNPITTFNFPHIRFFGAATSYDLVVIGTNATATRFSVQPTDTRIMLPTSAWQFGPGVKIKKIDITSTPTGAEQDTGWNLPSKAVVLDVSVDVTVVEATGGTKTLDVGLLSSETNGDADGFLDGVSVATTTGIKQGSLAAAGVTLGVLMKETVTDSAAGTHSARKPFATTNGVARSVTYTAGSNDFAEFRGSIYITYMEIAA